MPNNPGRIEGDYSIGEPEQVKYADPGSFGAVRVRSSRTGKYALVIAVVLIVLLAAAFVLR